MASYVIIAASAFLFGSLPTGFLVARAYDIDIRETGSGNIGATNVTRAINPWMGRIVFVVDMIKGLVPTLLAPHLFPQLDSAVAQAVACSGSILGHNYTPWLCFKGGKGVAAAMGGFLAICWPAQVSAGAVWLIVFAVWRYSSLASIISMLSVSVFMYPFTHDWKLTGFALVVALVTVGRHTDNIRRILNGSEFKFKRRGA